MLFRSFTLLEIFVNMKLKEILSALHQWAPPALQEGYDNSGLLVGSPEQEVTQLLVSLDCTEAVVQEAIARGCQAVVSHHPIVFGGMKRFTGANYVERTVMQAIKHDIALVALHTNLDNVPSGVNHKLAEVIGIKNPRILSPRKNDLCKIVTFVPKEHAPAVREAMFAAGAGTVGAYDHCSFNSEGYGTFRASHGSNPFVGGLNQDHFEEEEKIETICPQYLKERVVAALIAVHPYEEVAYDIIPLLNTWSNVGAGMIGEVPEQATLEFLQQLKEKLNIPVLRHTKLLKERVSKVAICGGSGFFLLPNAISAGADIFITSDVKYHQFFDAEEKIVLVDAGHYETEQFTSLLIRDFLVEKFPKFAVLLSEVKTNPVNYL
jgi:dinuclear metal center YbgI/SA1388 family protein